MTRTMTAAIALATAAMTASATLPALADNHKGDMADKTVVGAAMASDDLETLAAAVEAAGLVDTLEGEGPFTVFAPTDDAFAALPEGTLDTLLMPENKDQLAKILSCHVVSADVMSEALAGMIEEDGGTHPIPTVGGCTLQATMTDGAIMIEDETGASAEVTMADLDLSNGVVHVVDKVLLPAG